MSMRRTWIWYFATPLIVLGCLLLAFLNASGQGFGVGYFLGTVFGHATLAAAWTAFGPLRWAWRLPLSLLWLAAVNAALAWNIFRMPGGPRELMIAIACCVFGQFLILQIPFWGLMAGYGLQLRYFEDSLQSPDPKELQFGIRELLVFTTIIAVLLGLGRVAVSLAPIYTPWMGPFVPIVAFFTVAAALMTAPLLLAALLPRLALPAVLLAILFVGIATLGEISLVESFQGDGQVAPEAIVSVNTFAVAWILTISSIVRLCGYRFARNFRGKTGALPPLATLT